MTIRAKSLVIGRLRVVYSLNGLFYYTLQGLISGSTGGSAWESNPSIIINNLLI